jgi:type VI secretion system secreted protein Hcp
MLKTKLVALTVASATALVIAPSAHAATDYFMRLDSASGDAQIKGEALDPQFKGWTEIKSFSFGSENPTTIGSATGGAGAGKLKFDNLVIEKNVDSQTPQILQRMGQGKHFAGVEIVARKAGAAPVSPTSTANVTNRYYFSLAFPVSDQQTGDAGGDGGPQEKLTFAYGGLAQKYTPQNVAGAPANPVLGQWNAVTNSLTWDQLPTLPNEMTNPTP